MEIFMEFRAGVGGEESNSFLQELMGAYGKYARRKNWEISMPDTGSKTKLLIISGEGVEEMLGEAGVHRVQRESKGKLHTSAVSIATFRESSENPKVMERDFRFETYRASGAGGQHRNTTDSAIRLIHIPTGTTVTCASERSQYKNKAIAMSIMMNRLDEKQKDENERRVNQGRSEQIGSGDRSEARRTYNFPRKEVLDNITGIRIPLKKFFKGDFEGEFKK